MNQLKLKIPEHLNILIKQVSQKPSPVNKKTAQKKGSSRGASKKEVDTPNSKHI